MVHSWHRSDTQKQRPNTMKKIIISFLLITSSHFLFAQGIDFAGCIRSADTYYEENNTRLVAVHNDTISRLETEKDNSMRNAFIFSRLRQSLLRMQEVRINHKKNITEADTLFKTSLSKLRDEHRNLVDECSQEKKALDYTPEVID